MTREEKKNTLHCLKVMIGEEVCEECDLYGTTGTDHCEADCVMVAIKVLEQEPCENMGDVSDGYHTFNQLYYQRAVLFATIVNEHPDISWKSFRHSDGHYCFDEDGEMFIAGIDTPEGSYTYHYHKKYWDLFRCKELERGKEWDGHTEKDVTRLLSLKQEPYEDAISRKAAKLKVASVVWEVGDTWDSVHDKCVDCLDELPSTCKEAVEIVRDLCVKAEPPVTPKPTECEDAVSRTDLLDAIYDLDAAFDDNFELDYGRCYKTDLEKMAMALPSVTPQPEIVRCKDCKHRNAENGFCKGRGWPMQLVPDDGFCDKGERRIR